MTVEFQINGQEFIALNGGKLYYFTPAISFVVNCDSQEDQACGWPKIKMEYLGKLFQLI